MELVPPRDINSHFNATPLVERLPFFGRRNQRELTPQEQRILEQRRDPRAEALSQQEKWPPDIEETTRDTMARAMVREFRDIRAVEQAGGALEAWQTPYRKLMEQAYREANSAGNLDGATDDELFAAFNTVLAGERRDQYMVGAIKIVESQQEALQAVTKAQSEVARGSRFFSWRNEDQDIEERNHVPVIRSVGTNGSSEPMNNAQARGGAVRRFLRAPVSFIFGDALTAQNRDLRHEGRKRWFVNHAIFFPDSATYEENPAIAGPGGPRNLSETQKQYIQRLNLARLTRPGAPIERGAMEEISNELHTLMEARMNFYAHHDRILRGTDLNMINVDDANNVADIPVSNREVSLLRHGFDNLNMTIGREADREAFLVDVMNQMSTATEQDVRNAMKERFTLPVVEDQIRILVQQTQPRSLSEAERRNIDNLNTDQAAFEGDRAIVTEFRQSEAAEAELNRQIGLLAARIPANVDQYNDPNVANNQSIAHFERQNRNEETNIADLTRRITTLTDQQRDIRNSMKDKNANIASLQAQLDAIHTDLNDPGAGLERQLRDARTANQTTKDELQMRRDEVAKYKTLVDDRNAKQAQVQEETRKRAELRHQLDNAKKVDGTPRYAAGAAMDVISAEIDRVSKESAANIARIESAAKADRFKTRELDALRLFHDNIAQTTADEDIQDRASQRADGIEISMKLDEAERVYPALDRTYLRTLQVLFGDYVTMDNEAGRELFQRASRLVTPENYQSLVGSYTRRVIASAADIDGDFINHMVDDMHIRARNRTLGKMEPAHEQRMRQIEQVAPVDVTAEKTALAIEETNRLNNYDTQLGARKDAIKAVVDAGRALGPPPTSWADLADELNIAYFPGEAVFTAATVQHMFDESARTGNNEYNAHMPTRETIQQLSELVAVDRDRESQQLFVRAVEQLVADPVVVAEVTARIGRGQNIETVMSDPAFLPHRDNMRRALHMANSANTLLGSLAYILSPQRFSQVELGLRQGRSLWEAAAAQPDAQAFMQEVATILGGMTLTQIEQNNGVAEAAVARAILSRPDLSPGGVVDTTLIRTIEAARGTENRLRLDQVIQRYSRIFPHYEDVDDLTAKIVYDSRLQNNLQYAKMLAQEVIKYRAANGTP